MEAPLGILPSFQVSLWEVSVLAEEVMFHTWRGEGGHPHIRDELAVVDRCLAIPAVAHCPIVIATIDLLDPSLGSQSHGGHLGRRKVWKVALDLASLLDDHREALAWRVAGLEGTPIHSHLGLVSLAGLPVVGTLLLVAVATRAPMNEGEVEDSHIARVANPCTLSVVPSEDLPVRMEVVGTAQVESHCDSHLVAEDHPLVRLLCAFSTIDLLGH